MMKENVYTIFYSWQSDKPEVKKAIFKGLNSAKQTLYAEGIELIIEQDTSGRIGTKNIETEVLRKIDDCDVFVADVTPICRISSEENNHKISKLLPNPNVMYECGYALGVKGLNRMIFLASFEDDEIPGMLPFDINHNTITNIRNTKVLTSLTTWIKAIINDVSAERKNQKNDYGCQVFFMENGQGYEQVTIHPKYKKIQYVNENSRKSVSLNSRQPHADMLNTDMMKAYLESVYKTKSLILPQELVDVNTYSRIINYAICPIRLTIANVGRYELENLFLFVKIETAGIFFAEDNIEKGLPVSFKQKDYALKDKINLTAKLNVLNPDMQQYFDVVYLNVPHGIESVTLKWSMSSTRHRQDGELNLFVQPDYVFDLQENNTKVGTTEIVPYKEYK